MTFKRGSKGQLLHPQFFYIEQKGQKRISISIQLWYCDLLGPSHSVSFHYNLLTINHSRMLVSFKGCLKKGVGVQNNVCSQDTKTQSSTCVHEGSVSERANDLRPQSNLSTTTSYSSQLLEGQLASSRQQLSSQLASYSSTEQLLSREYSSTSSTRVASTSTLYY